MKNTEKAFQWIIRILQKRNIPFQITGGLAAKVYGSNRPLDDIDIDIQEERLTDIVPDVKLFIVFGPERFTDDKWDILHYMKLEYEGQDIDICGNTAKVKNPESIVWKDMRTDFTQSQHHMVYGISVPVINKSKLIEYKKILNRSADVEDIKAIL